MTGLPLVLVYAAVFVGVLLTVDGVYRLVTDARHGGPQGKINRRLRMLASGADPQEVLRLLWRSRRQERSLFDWIPLLVRLDVLITQAGLLVSTPRVLAIMVTLGVLVFWAAKLLFVLPTLVALSAGLASGVGGPWAFLTLRRRQRLNRFNQQLPDAIDLIVRSLRAGHPLNAAMSVVAAEMPDPLGSEFGVAIDEATYGLDIRDAVQNMADRVGLPDLHYMVVSIRIQYGTGGNLAEILASLSKVIRDRFNMFRKIKAVSAEGRFSGYVLSGLPILTGLAIWTLNPEYYLSVSDDPRATYLVYLVAVLMALNMLIIRRLVNFRV
jgi:tight adherence protein B